MYPVFESIKVIDKSIIHFEAHLERMQHTAKDFWNKELHFDSLRNDIEKAASAGLQKCRVLYDQSEYHIECLQYTKRAIRNLHIINDNEIKYDYKYLNRNCFTKYLDGLDGRDTILIIKKDRLTDTAYSNIALWNGHEWHTPKYPLFKGIKRKFLVDHGVIHEKDILLSKLYEYKQVALINALLDLGDVEVNVANIVNL